jgi:hypothetical protein
MNLPTSSVLKVKQIDLPEKSVYRGKAGSPKFSSRLWMAELIRYRAPGDYGNCLIDKAPQFGRPA